MFCLFLDIQSSHNKAVVIPQMQFLCCKSEFCVWKAIEIAPYSPFLAKWYMAYRKSSLANEWQWFDKISMIYNLVIEW